jgi:hypothetical protein
MNSIRAKALIRCPGQLIRRALPLPVVLAVVCTARDVRRRFSVVRAGGAHQAPASGR